MDAQHHPQRNDRGHEGRATMNCARCRRPISSAEEKKAHIEKDDKGRIKRIRHRKCYFIDKREAKTNHGALVKGRYLPDAPTPYEVLRRRQAELDEQHGLEERPESWSDPHDPIVAEM
jgi:hypothetical protein